jgi:hypothetical protein
MVVTVASRRACARVRVYARWLVDVALVVSTLAAPPATLAAHSRATEVARIRAHSDSVRVEIPTHDTRPRTPSQLALVAVSLTLACPSRSVPARGP